jgi:hypothetical protein
MLELMIRMVGNRWDTRHSCENDTVPYFLWIGGCIFMYTLIYIEPH